MRPVTEITRFAPSPTGRLHLGHAFAAITAHETARRSGATGRFLLRIEDLDQTRARDEFIDGIYEDLAWLGLNWEQPVLCQSTRGDAYRTALETLELKELIYPCFCTRREISDELSRAAEAPHGGVSNAGTGIYPGTCRQLTKAERVDRIQQGQRYALRLDCAKALEYCTDLTFVELTGGPNAERGVIPVRVDLFGDVVLSRKDLPAAYHLAVVVDDAYQGVTVVTRGNDLFGAAHLHRVLQRLLGLPVPRYSHHRLILDETGRKFSKRDQAITLSSLRNGGMTPADIRARVSSACAP
jgi:glutamyl-Q tRNA(Asp) synthetase